MNDYLKNMVKASGNKYATVVDDGIDGSDVDGFVNTGSYIMNALLSGSIHGGIANNKILAIAGETSTGKTYFSLGIVHKFLTDHKDSVVLYFDSEQAVTSSGYHNCRQSLVTTRIREKEDSYCLGFSWNAFN